MLTKKDLLLTGIELPKEQDEVQMALPPSKGVTKEKKRIRFLSRLGGKRIGIKANKKNFIFHYFLLTNIPSEFYIT